MRLFAGADPVRVMASGAMDVNHKDEIYDGKVSSYSWEIGEDNYAKFGMIKSWLCVFSWMLYNLSLR